MRSDLNMSQELLAVFADLAVREDLRGSLIILDDSVAETLRWLSNGPAFLLRDISVRNIVSWSSLLECKSEQDISALFSPFGPPMGDDAHSCWRHIVFVLSDFLWTHEAQLVDVLNRCRMDQISICTVFSEPAHDCYEQPGDELIASQPPLSNESRDGKVKDERRHDDRRDARMDFSVFAQRLRDKITFLQDPVSLDVLRQRVTRHRQEQVTTESKRLSFSTEMKQSVVDGQNTSELDEDTKSNEDEWGWGDEEEEEEEEEEAEEGQIEFQDKEEENKDKPSTAHEPIAELMRIRVHHVPLHFGVLLNQPASSLPSTFVLTNKTCARVFPMMKCHSKRLLLSREYKTVEQIPPQEIPSSLRKQFKLVSYTLADFFMQMRLQTKDHIFALGATSLKVGHTLLDILEARQRELTIYEMKDMRKASVVLVDRTLDLASPCAHSGTLLDRILAVVPRGKSAVNHELNSEDVSSLHFTEVAQLKTAQSTLGLNWDVTCSVLPLDSARAAMAMECLAGKPAKAALNHFIKEIRQLIALQEKKTGRKVSIPELEQNRSALRGRDHLSLRLCALVREEKELACSNSALLQMSLSVLEAIPRLEKHPDWSNEKVLREFEARHAAQATRRSSEWILPEVADWVAKTKFGDDSSECTLRVLEALKLAVHSYALGGAAGFDEVISETMFLNALLDAVWRLPREEIESLFMLSTYLRKDLVREAASRNPVVSHEQEHGKDQQDEWDWADEDDDNDVDNDVDNERKVDRTASNSCSHHSSLSESEQFQIKQSLERELSSVIQVLKECGSVRQSLTSLGEYEVHENHAKSLLAQLLHHLTDPAHEAPAELQHVVNASAQLTRVGIDVLKSSFSLFGFGNESTTRSSTGSGSGASTSDGAKHAFQNDIVVLFVIGGITFQEIQDIRDVLKQQGVKERGVQVIVGSTAIVNGDIILRQVFNVVD